ncbi:MAG: hypothetical protein J6A69_00720 [Clostridia bacterium]|nr:hypothetical protein [Clostridia bacterium]
MRKIRRLFSLLLVFIISMSSVSAFAYNDIPASEIIDYIFKFDVGELSGEASVEDSASDPDMQTISFLHSIGIWDDTEKSKESFLTMTEFAVIMSNARLGKENALENVYIQNPDNNKVTYGYALECIVNALGYGYKYEYYGKTNEALLIVCDEINILSSYPESTDEFISRKDLAHLLKKALTTDLCVADYSEGGSVNYTVVPGKNLLNTIHGIYDVSGFVNAVRGLSVYGGATLRDGYIEINRTKINTDGSDLSGYFSKQVEAYAMFNELIQEYKIVYIAQKSDSKYMEIDFNNISEYNDSEIIYIDENGNENSVIVGNVNTVTENGKRISSLSQMESPKNCEGKIVLTASEDEGTIDTALIYRYNYYVVDYVDASLLRIGLKNGQTYKGEKYIQLDNNGINSVSIYGVKANYTDIPLNSTIRVLECSETNYFCIDASSERQKGEVASISDDVIEVAGKSYRLSKDLIKHIKYCEDNNITSSDRAVYPQLGNAYTFYIMDGVIAGITVGADLYSYGIVKAAMKSRTSIDPEISLRVFTEDGEWKNFTFADKIELEGTAGVSKENVSTFIETNAGEIVGGLIRYKANSSDKITSLFTAKDNGLGESNPDDVNFVEEITAMVDWTKWFIQGSNYLFNPNAKVFVIPTNKTRESEYKVLNPSAFENGMVYTMSLYNPDDFLQVGAVIYNGNLSDAAAESNTPTFLYVESMRRVVIDKEDFVYGYKVIGMEGIRGGGKGTGTFEKRSYYLKEDDYNRKMAAGEEFYVGDFLKIDVVGTNLVDWSVDIRGGKPYLPSRNFEFVGTGTIVTEETDDYYMYDYETNTVNTYELLYGKIVRINYEEFLILVDCGEYGLRTVGTRILGSVNKNTHKLENLSISNFHVGEEVQIITGGPNAYLTLKYEN